MSRVGLFFNISYIRRETLQQFSLGKRGQQTFCHDKLSTHFEPCKTQKCLGQHLEKFPSFLN